MSQAMILVLGLCLATSFLMSGMEAGVFALSRLRIRQQMRSGNPRAQALYAHLENPENFLWTILVGNTLANVSAFIIGVFALHQWLGRWPVLLCVALLAGGILFYALCELMPKTLFRLYPNRLCMMMAIPFRLVHLALKPLVSLMALFAGSLLRWSGGKRFTGHLFGNRDELRTVMQESAQSLTSEERTMINRVLDLQNLTVCQVAIPLAKAVTVSMETTVRDLFALSRERGFSRLPVWKTGAGRRRIAGLVLVRPLLFQSGLDENRTAAEFLKPALYLQDELRLEVALRQMQRTGQRMGIVVGPGGVELGLISLQDILKVIFGEVSL